MKYKISVIIPTYNSEEFLDSTIDSVMKQTIGFENIELILVDDYSTDSTPQKIEEYCSKYENIKTYESGKKTFTPGRGRNIGIKNSRAEYIMFLDHDDLYSENAAELLYNAIESENADLAIGKFKMFGENNFVLDDWIKEDFTINSISENIRLFSINNIWRMIFPKEFLLKNNIKFPEGVFAEDLAFMVESFIKADKITFKNEIVYNFRLRTGEGSSTSLSKGKNYLEGLINGFDYVYDVLKDTKSCQYYDNIFNQHLCSWLNDLILSVTISPEEKYQLIEQSHHLYKNIKVISPIPENKDIKAISELIKENKIESAYEKMGAYKKSIDLQNSKKSTKTRIKNVARRIKNKL